MLNPLVWLMVILDFVVWLVIPPLLNLFNMIFFYTKGVLSEGGFDDTARRNKDLGATEGLITSPEAGVHFTAHDLFQTAFRDYADRKCYGTRKFIKMHKPEGSKFPLKVFGDTSWLTYAEVGENVKNLGAGLIALGMRPMPIDEARATTDNFAPISSPSCLLIFEETCKDWMTCAAAAMTQSMCCATSYATLGMSSVAEAINQTSAPGIMCNYSAVVKVAAMASKECTTLKFIIYSRNCVPEDSPPHPDSVSGIKVLSVDEAIELGKQNPTPMQPPQPDHLGLIMYTSGSTGKPKGVMLKQSNICAAVAGMSDYLESLLGKRTPTRKQETYLAYLPAAHILEFAVECGCLYQGFAFGFSDPKTISSKGARRLMSDGSLNGEATGYGNYPPGGIQEFAPTIMAAVPKIWDILKKGVEAVIATQSPLIKSLWCAAFATRSFALKTGRTTPVVDLLFKKTYVMLGGRLKLCVTGGGPLSPDVQNFIRVVFKTNLVQGYALTETCSAGTVQPPWNTQNSVVGPPLKCVEMRLDSCTEVKDRDEQPYLNSDKSHYGTPCLGRGEVWIRGAAVSAGYYIMEKKTKEDFDDKGWFHTGDIAIWTKDGMIKIVDRLKNLIKLKGGEYIAIESMESTYANSVFVNGVTGGIMCYGNGDMDRPVALVQVTVGELIKWAKGAGIEYSSVENLCQNPAAISYVTQDLNSIGKGKLGGNELLASITLIPGENGDPEAQNLDSPWTPENNFLTASNKLNRKPIEKGLDKLLAPLILKGIK